MSDKATFQILLCADEIIIHSGMPATGRSYTQNFFNVQYIIIQAIFSRKSLKKFVITDEKIFRVFKAFDRKK